MPALPPGFEPFVQLVDVIKDAALVAWGGFHLIEEHGRWGAAPHGKTSGAGSEPLGRAAVEVVNDEGDVVGRATTEAANRVWVEGLAPGTPTATGWRARASRGAGTRLDSSPRRAAAGVAAIGPRLTTHAEEERPEPLTFLALGDFGVGIDSGKNGQQQLGLARTMQRSADTPPVRFIVGLGDTIYHAPKASSSRPGRWMTTGG